MCKCVLCTYTQSIHSDCSRPHIHTTDAILFLFRIWTAIDSIAAAIVAVIVAFCWPVFSYFMQSERLHVRCCYVVQYRQIYTQTPFNDTQIHMHIQTFLSLRERERKNDAMLLDRFCTHRYIHIQYNCSSEKQLSSIFPCNTIGWEDCRCTCVICRNKNHPFEAKSSSYCSANKT